MKDPPQFLRHIRCSVTVPSLLLPDRCHTWGFEYLKTNRDMIPGNFPAFCSYQSHNWKAGKNKHTNHQGKFSVQSCFLSSCALNSPSPTFPRCSQIWALNATRSHIQEKVWSFKRVPRLSLLLAMAHFLSGPQQGQCWFNLKASEVFWQSAKKIGEQIPPEATNANFQAVGCKAVFGQLHEGSGDSGCCSLFQPAICCLVTGLPLPSDHFIDATVEVF